MNTLDDIKGSEKTISDIRGFISGGGIHHAYLIEGPSSAPKMDLAKGFAMALLCRERPGEGCGKCRVCRMIGDENHPDLTFLRAVPSQYSSVKSIRDDDVEHLIDRLRSRPQEADRNIAVIDDFDKLTRRAYNRLLKTLEEPPEGTVMMMLTENTMALPPTIVSRCVVLRMYGTSEGTGRRHEAAGALVEAISERSSYRKVKDIIDKEGPDRDNALVLLDSMEEIYREKLTDRNGGMKKEYVFRAVGEIERARDKIRRNISVAYALKQMALAIGG